VVGYNPEEWRCYLSKATPVDMPAPAEEATEERPATNKTDREGDTPGGNPIVGSITGLSRVLENEGEANRREERSEDIGNKWLQGLTLAFVIATTVGIFWQASIFNGQLIEMKNASSQTGQLIEANAKLAQAATDQATAAAKQAEATDKEATAMGENTNISHENMILAQRAWVGPSNAAFLTEPTVGKPLEIVINYQNSGREPALDFVYFGEPFPATTAEDNSGVAALKISQYLEACKAIRETRVGSVVYPSTGFSSYTLNAKTKDDFVDEAIAKGDKMIFFQGCFLYKTFDAPRHSYFCYFYKQGQSKSQNLNICAGGHYAD
jgi:hypothetical protein